MKKYPFAHSSKFTKSPIQTVALPVKCCDCGRVRPKVRAELGIPGVPTKGMVSVPVVVGGSSPDLCVKAEEAPRLRLGCLGDLLFLEE